MIPFSATLRLDSQLRKAQGNSLPINTLTNEWNVSLHSYGSIRILEKIAEQYRKSRFSQNECLQIDGIKKRVTWEVFTF